MSKSSSSSFSGFDPNDIPVLISDFIPHMRCDHYNLFSCLY